MKIKSANEKIITLPLHSTPARLDSPQLALAQLQRDADVADARDGDAQADIR